MPISVGMKEYIRGSAFVSTFIKVTAKDGTVIAISNHTRNLVIDGTNYLAWPLQPTQFNQTAGLNADNAELDTVMADPFSDIKLRGKKWSGARVLYQLFNPADITLGPLFSKSGFIGDLTIRKFSVTSQFRSMSQLLNQPIGEMVMEDCIVIELGDADCGVNLAGNTVTGWPISVNTSISSFANQQQFTVGLGSPRPDDFFKMGKVLWTSGGNDDLEMHILKSVGNQITLFGPAFFNMQVGDTLTLIAGCNRTRAQCRDTFANVRRFKGYPDLPGRSRLLRFPEGA